MTSVNCAMDISICNNGDKYLGSSIYVPICRETNHGQSFESYLIHLVRLREIQSNSCSRTVLLYPATAYLVIFCSFVATSDIGGFNLMKAIVDCLAQSGINYPLIQLWTLFRKLSSLSRGFFDDEGIPIQMIPLEPRSYSLLFYPFSPLECR